ncbi:MAG: AIPR family protein [Phycisphaerales bacterium]|nr:AIPR family protein [Phycisphaerales bacterium]
MPTRDEQVAQIEAALRHRFFPLVPRVDAPDRAGWTDEQHDTDRLSRALAAYAVVGLCEVDDGVAAGAITDGKNDGGIDALYFDQAQNRLLVVQSKFKRTGTAPAQDEVLKTINGVKALMARRFGEFNTAFQNRADQIEEALDTPGVVVTVILAYLGDNLGPHVGNDLNALKVELNTVSECCKWDGCGLSIVHGWLVAEQTPAAVTANFVLENWSSTAAPRKAIYGQISAASLAALVTQHGKALFQRNIRHYLGSVGVNTAIERTVRNHPGDFFYLNNGLTAVAEQITQAAGLPARCSFALKNLSIVNGAQTAGAIANAAIAGQISPDAKLLVTIIEIGVTTDDIGVRITRARNHQNVVRSVDFAALDPTQERLRRELAAAGITYHYRPSAEARMRRDDAFAVEDAAIALACLSFDVLTNAQMIPLRVRNQPILNAVDFVVAAKKEVSRLWDQDGDLYKKLFPADLSAVRTCRLVQVFRFIDQILAATERSELDYYRRMFFRHARYFIMAFVARRCAAVLDRAALTLSQADRDELSRQTNELAEVIYAVSVPQQGLRGYLAIFRNLTDAQPLAERVLTRLDAPPAGGAVAAAPVVAHSPAPGATATAAPTTPTPGGQQGTVS